MLVFCISNMSTLVYNMLQYLFIRKNYKRNLIGINRRSLILINLDIALNVIYIYKFN